MAKGRNGMLGVGGQRRTMSRKALRGEAGASQRGGGDAVAQKKALLSKMRERNANAAASEPDQADQA
ncbi:hypothetical protein GCM10023085_39990 [Actinomadura viridis]|uniref:Nitrous oxide reductase n=1 Tax=Actinomadura viridis TaxID=58110 RepID=A0A931GU32_9ACTN|nr:DUF6243 family protein [Actinomadura viridis]MBG6092719.1 nitrous oxide reductase [Actinomadura viridis]